MQYFPTQPAPVIVLRHLAVRLAAEGVPVAAIARITSIEPSVVRTVLLDAIATLTLRAMPANEWPHGSLVETRAPTIPPIVIDDITDLALRIVTRSRCAQNPARLIAALLLHGRLSQRALMDIVWKPGSAISFETLHAVCSDARKVVAPLGGEILAIRSNGHFIPDDQRETLLRHFSAEVGNAVAA